MEALDMVVIFAFLTYMEKGKIQKNKTNTDPTTNSNPKPFIDKAAKQTEPNKVP